MCFIQVRTLSAIFCVYVCPFVPPSVCVCLFTCACMYACVPELACAYYFLKYNWLCARVCVYLLACVVVCVFSVISMIYAVDKTLSSFCRIFLIFPHFILNFAFQFVFFLKFFFEVTYDCSVIIFGKYRTGCCKYESSNNCPVV